MYRVRQEALPFVGSSHEFVGAEQGDVGVSVFLFSGLPARVRGRIGIPTTRFSSSAKAAESAGLPVIRPQTILLPIAYLLGTVPAAKVLLASRFSHLVLPN